MQLDTTVAQCWHNVGLWLVQCSAIVGSMLICGWRTVVGSVWALLRDDGWTNAG